MTETAVPGADETGGAPQADAYARGAYVKDLGNTPGHVNHWSKRAFVALLSRHGEVVEARSPFPWTMLLVRL